MSDDDRMDRARKLRELREGRREDPDDDASGASTDAADDETTDGTAETAGDPADLDDTVAEAVERVTDTSAEVPDPQDMGSEVAEAVAAADADETPTVSEPETVGVARGQDTSREAETRVLEFTLGEERYCLDIDYVEEIVKDTEHTRVPNTPDFVEGVVDLRGQITTLLNPKVLMDTEETEPGDLLVVFDGEAFEEQGHLGWVVDDVRQVSPVADEDVTDAPVDEPYINGVVDRGEDDEDFVVWTSPAAALEEAT
jgi:purine-binding chemotaxis protein CheW